MIVSCKHPNPQFEGQTKGRLGNSEVRKLADNVFHKDLKDFYLKIQIKQELLWKNLCWQQELE